MTLRTKTLTAVAALTISAAGFALAQDGSTTTVPLQQPAEAQSAPVAEGSTTFVATPTDDAATGDADTEDAAADAAPAEEDQPAEEAPAAEAAADEPATQDDTAPATDETAGDKAADEAAADQDAAEADAEPTAEPAADTDAEPADAGEQDEAATDAGEAATDDAIGDEMEEPTEAEPVTAEETGETIDSGSAGAGGGAHDETGAGEHEGGHIEDISFSFEGPFGKFDQFQLQRGLQVYTEVCSACHGMKFVPIRTLADDGGPALPEDQVRAYAANMSEVTDEETGEDRTRLPTDHFPEVTGMGMGPDLSLMAKARAGFHGPYGTGLSQLFRGIGGPEYIHALLTSYTGEEVEQAGSVFYVNTAFSTGAISMPPPLSDDLVTYEDGTPATVDQMSRDVSAFLMWTAEPKMMDRKMVGLVSVLFLIVLTALLYLTNKRLWAPHKGAKRSKD